MVIPKVLRDQAGLVPGAELNIALDGAGIRIEAAVGVGLAKKGRFLVIPASDLAIDDEVVDRLRRDGQR